MTGLLRRPLLLWVAYLGVLALLALAARALLPDLTSGAEGLSGEQLLVQALITLIPLPVAAYLGWRWIGFLPPRRLYLVAFPAATVVFGYANGFESQTVASLLLAVILVCLVALGEEIAFRGVLLRLLLPKGLWRAVAVSSALFGLTHVVNLLLGAPPAGVALQVLLSGMGAAGYAALAIRTGSLWPSIVLHAAYDLAFRIASIEPGSWHASLYYTLHGVGGLIFAAILLRRRAPHELRPRPTARSVGMVS